MTISIVSTFYNDKKMLKLMMDSVLAQDYSNIEHVVTDADPTDGSVDLLQEYEKKYAECGKKLIWVSERGNGIYDSFNRVANMSSGNSLMFGSDPYYDTHSISLVVIESIVALLSSILAFLMIKRLGLQGVNVALIGLNAVFIIVGFIFINCYIKKYLRET